ncbi:MAG: hypothetical protein KDD03_08915 [Gelidibacter sp.]|nr:hypothetical protein [Gelidibacter sp.]
MSKYKKLALGIVFDALGYISFIIPGIGEFADIVWAPASAWLMTKMYKGKSGKVAAVITFIEEALPGFDIIPSFTLMWLYTYVFSNEEKTIQIKQ